MKKLLFGALCAVMFVCTSCDSVANFGDSDTMKRWVYVQCSSSADLAAVFDDYVCSLTPQDGEPAATFGTGCDYLLVDFFATEFRFRREAGRYPAYDDEDAWLMRLDKEKCEQFAHEVYQTDMTDWDESWGEANLAEVTKLSNKKYASAMRKIYRGYIEQMQKNADETVHFLGYRNQMADEEHLRFATYDLTYRFGDDLYVLVWFVEYADGTREWILRDTSKSIWGVLPK